MLGWIITLLENLSDKKNIFDIAFHSIFSVILEIYSFYYKSCCYYCSTRHSFLQILHALPINTEIQRENYNFWLRSYYFTLPGLDNNSIKHFVIDAVIHTTRSSFSYYHFLSQLPKYIIIFLIAGNFINNLLFPFISYWYIYIYIFFWP